MSWWPTMKVKFEGGKEIEKALRELDISQARKKGIARRALDKAAQPIRDDWARNVDRDEGDLKRSVKIGNRAQTKATRKFKRTGGKDIVERYVGIDATEDSDGRLPVYAYIEEFGSEDEPANPAGRNAFERNKMDAMDRIGDELWKEIDKTAKREAKKK